MPGRSKSGTRSGLSIQDGLAIYAKMVCCRPPCKNKK